MKALRMEFSGCVEAMQAHAASWRLQTRQTHHLIALPESFVRQVLAGLDLRSRSSLKRHAAKFIECLPEAFRPSLHVWAEDHFASSTSLVSGQLYLDLAMLVFHRKRMSSIGQVFIFAWGDSTTKGHLDMYNTRHRWLPADRSVDLARAFRWLCSHQLKQDNDENDLGLDHDPAIIQGRCVRSQLVFDNVHLHTQLPQLLGQGRTKLIDKVSAHVHSTLLEVGTVDRLSATLESCIAWCSDMGTEVLFLPKTTLPIFVRPSRLQEASVCEEEGVAVEALLEEQPQQATPSNLMPNAIHIPGMCHAMHNASSNLDTCFSDWATFFDQLKTLHKFIGARRRRDRFMEVVLRGQGDSYAECRRLFKQFSHSLYSERWGEVASYLRDGLPILFFLRASWDEVAYSRGMDDPS